MSANPCADQNCESGPRPAVPANPRAVIIVRALIQPDTDWLAANPDERMVDEDGRALRMWSVASRPGRRHALSVLARLIRHMNDVFPDHFGGVHPLGQSTAEWFYERSQFKLTGYDHATRDAWREWRRAKGLAGWETAEVPSPALRRKRTEGSCFLDPASQSEVIAFNTFLQDDMTDWLGELTGAVRSLTNGRKLCLLFYGYGFDFLSNGPAPAMTGHYGVARLLDQHASDIDILCAPISYINRGWTGTAMMMGASETVERYGVMWFDENDARTCRAKCDAANSGPALCLQTRQKTLDVLRRDTTREAVRNIGAWWLDLQGRGWYDDVEFWKVLDDLRDFDRKAMARKRPFRPEMALIIDEESVLHLGAGMVAETGVLVHFRRAASLIGAPFGQYLLSDVKRRPLDAKFEVHLATWFATPDSPRPGVSRLFVQVPGAPAPVNLGVNDTVLSAKELVPSYEPEVLDAFRPERFYDLARMAGVHLYLERKDIGKAVVWADSDLVAVQAREDCELDLHLPGGRIRRERFREGELKSFSADESIHFRKISSLQRFDL